MVTIFLISLLLTVFIELLVTYFSYEKITHVPQRGDRLVLGVIIASSLTLPYLHFVFPHFLGGVMYVVVAEVFAVLVETIFYRSYFGISGKEAFILSFLTNLLSFGVGILLFW